MTEPVEILSEYIAAYRAGDTADPLEYLRRLEGSERDELADLMEAFHAREGRRPFDPAAFERSPARATANQTARAVLGKSGLWPELLPRLRHRAQISRADLVARLASDLGLPERQQKVHGYYHEMEQGSLPAACVSDRVLQALGRIVGEQWEALREAGRATAAAVGPPAGRSTESAFARRAGVDLLHSQQASGVPAQPTVPASQASPGTDDWDEVDELFRGGATP